VQAHLELAHRGILQEHGFLGEASFENEFLDRFCRVLGIGLVLVWFGACLGG
jgi:hypothetical protein